MFALTDLVIRVYTEFTILKKHDTYSRELEQNLWLI